MTLVSPNDRVATRGEGHMIPIQTAPATSLVKRSDYVRLTRVVYDGNRATGPVYINRHLVTDVTDDRDGNVFVHFLGERSVQVAESLECVVGMLER